MANLTNVLVSIFEEQAALLQRHIAILKANAILEQTPADIINDKKKAVKIVDPDMPKKAPNAYLVYLSENQAPFKASNPTMSQAEVMATLGKRWTALSADAKERFNKQAEVLKASQQEKIAAYVATKSTSSSSAIVVAKAPKAPKSAKLATAPVKVGLTAEAVAPIVEAIKEMIAPEPEASLVIFAPIAATTSSTDADAEKEHKIKKKKRKSEAAAAAAAAAAATAIEGSVEAAPQAAVIESLPVAVPESEKKKVSLHSFLDSNINEFFITWTITI